MHRIMRRLEARKHPPAEKRGARRRASPPEPPIDWSLSETGDLYQFGVYTAGGLKAWVDAIPELNLSFTGQIWGFDSFDGMPFEANASAYQSERHLRDPAWQQGGLNARTRMGAPDWPSLHAQLVRNIGFEPARTHLVRGFYNESLASGAAFARRAGMRPAFLLDIDCDLFSSSKQALEFMLLAGLLVPGTFVYYDDLSDKQLTGIMRLGDPALEEGLAHVQVSKDWGLRWRILPSLGLFPGPVGGRLQWVQQWPSKKKGDWVPNEFYSPVIELQECARCSRLPTHVDGRATRMQPARTSAGPDATAAAAGFACELLKSRSRDPCTLGSTFHCDATKRTLSVARGCRGVFRCGEQTLTCGSIKANSERCRCCPPGPINQAGRQYSLWPHEPPLATARRAAPLTFRTLQRRVEANGSLARYLQIVYREESPAAVPRRVLHSFQWFWGFLPLRGECMLDPQGPFRRSGMSDPGIGSWCARKNVLSAGRRFAHTRGLRVLDAYGFGVAPGASRPCNDSTGEERSQFGRLAAAKHSALDDETLAYAPDNAWTEVIRVASSAFIRRAASCSRDKRVLASEGGPNGCWFVVASGTGIFINTGRSLRVANRTELAASLGIRRKSATRMRQCGGTSVLFSLEDDHPLCPHLRRAGYDTLQIGASLTQGRELVSCWPSCTDRSIDGACVAGLRTGWGAHKPCECDGNLPVLNCALSAAHRLPWPQPAARSGVCDVAWPDVPCHGIPIRHGWEVIAET